MDLMRLLHNEACASTSLQAAITLVVGRLLEGGMSFQLKDTRTEVVQEPSTELQTIVNRYWLPFVRTAVQSFFLYGICVVTLVETQPGSGIMAPIVTPLHQYRLSVDDSTGRNQYHVRQPNEFTIIRSAGDDDHLKNTFVHTLTPPVGGRLCSRVIPVLARIVFLRTLWGNREFADHWRTHPPQVSQPAPNTGIGGRHAATDPLSNGAPPSDGVLGDCYAEADLDLFDGDRRSLLITDMNQRNASAAARSARRQNETSSRDVWNADTNRVHSTQYGAPWQHAIALAHGQQHVSHTVPSMLPEFSATIALLQTEIMLSLGVPASLLYPQNRQYAQDTIVALRMLNATVAEFRTTLSETLESLFYNVYGPLIAEENVRRGMRKARRLGRPLTDRDVGKITGHITVTATFNYTPLASISDILQLRDRKFLSHDAAGRYLFGQIGLSLGDLLTEDLAAVDSGPHFADAPTATKAVAPPPVFDPTNDADADDGADDDDDDDDANDDADDDADQDTSDNRKRKGAPHNSRRKRAHK